MTAEKTLAVFCPTCGVGAGEGCITEHGKPCFVHAQRWNLAEVGEYQAKREANKIVSLEKGEQEANAERHACRAIPSNGGNAA